MSKYVYPAVFTPEENGCYSVNFPNLESCYTSGENLENAVEMAQDVLCLTLYHMEESNKNIPEPSMPTELKVNNGEFVTLIICDTLEYRKFYDNKAVKKTLTIPSWLNTMSEQHNINFSAVLQKALKSELNI